MKIASRSCAPAAVSALVCSVLYAITIRGTYIYDDIFLVGEDPRVHNPKLWWQYWTRDWFYGGVDNLYRPLVSQSFGLQMWLHGNRAWAFHLVNILLAAASAALVAELARRLSGWRIALFAGLLFACHPIHSEAVAGIVGRAELACTTCVLAAMVLMLKSPMTTKRALAIAAVSLAAMLCKEQGLLLPPLLLILLPVRKHVLPVNESLSPQAQHSQRQAMLLVFALVVWAAGGLIVLREEILHLKFEWDPVFVNIGIQPMAKSPPLDRWLIPLALVGRYFQLLVVPLKLSIDYGLAVIKPTLSRSDPYLWLGVIVILAWMLITAICLIRRRWVASFCLIALALTYAPASNVILIATVFGERLMYLPSAFFAILVAMLLVRLPLPNLLLTILLALAITRTFTYVQRWNDRPAFYQYSLTQQPQSMEIHLLAADIDYEKYDLPPARKILAEAESISPEDWQLWQMSALIDERAGDWPSAQADWKRAFELYPTTQFNDRWAHAMEMLNKSRATTQK